jgi:hypothetical protein
LLNLEIEQKVGKTVLLSRGELLYFRRIRRNPRSGQDTGGLVSGDKFEAGEAPAFRFELPTANSQHRPGQSGKSE